MKGLLSAEADTTLRRGLGLSAPVPVVGWLRCGTELWSQNRPCRVAVRTNPGTAP
jgi:hypothetical protein